MKKLKLINILLVAVLLFSLIPVFNAGAVTTDEANLRQMFDRLDDKSKWSWYMSRPAGDGHVAFGDSFLMRAYLLMYQTTKDKYYLNEFVKVADSLLTRRDSVTGVKDYRGLSLPVWSSGKFGDEYKSYALHTGLIVTPMAQFASAVLKDPGLSSYNAKAKEYLQAAKDGIAAHDMRDKPQYLDANCNWIEDNTKMHLERPINMTLGIGSAMLAVYEATGDRSYLEKGIKITNFFKQYLILNKTANSYVWGYYPNDPRQRFTSTMEDTNHSATAIEFVNLAYRSGIFNATDMQRFANTAKGMINSDGTIAGYVDGSGTAEKPELFTHWLFVEPWMPTLFDVSYRILSPKTSVDPQMLAGVAMLNFYYADGSVVNPPTTVPSAGNLIENGDFSAGTAGWINLNNTGVIRTATDGNKYLANGYNYSFIRELNLAPGTYKLNAKTMRGSSGSGARLVVQYRDQSGNKTVPYDFRYTSSGSGWEAMPEMTLDVPSSAAVVRIYLLNSSSTGTQYFDDVTLVSAGGSSTPGTPTPTPDTEPPVAAVTAPSGGSELKDMVTLSANASDNKGVSRLTFAYAADPRGAWTPIGEASLTSGTVTDGTWQLAWDVTGVENGTYYVQVAASDAAGNKTNSQPVTYKVNNVQNLIENGDFSAGTAGWINLNNAGVIRTATDGNKYLVNGYNYSFIRELKLAPGTYKLNARAMRGSSGSGARIVVQYRDQSGNKTVPYDFRYTNRGSGWEAMPEMTLDVPSSAAVVRIYLLNSSSTGTHYFDDVALLPAS